MVSGKWLVVTIYLVCFYIAMISGMTQRIKKLKCQLSDSLKIPRSLMSNLCDKLPVCYAYAVIFICRFAKGFVLPFQRASFTLLFFFRIVPLNKILTFTFPLFRSSLCLVRRCSMFFLYFIFYFCVNKMF